MIVDLVRIFPRSCSINKIHKLEIDTLSITHITTQAHRCTIYLGKIRYCFSADDFLPEKGIDALGSIHLAERMIPVWKILYASVLKFDKVEADMVLKVIETCQNYLRYFERLYSINRSTSVHNN